METKAQIKIETFIEGPVGDVWEAITDKKLVSRWLMETNIEPTKGFKGYFKMPPMPGFNGHIEAEVIEVKEFKTFVYTWKGGWMKKPTTVKFSLEEKNGGTNLVLEHWGFEGILGNLLKKMMSGGWKKKITIQIAELIKEKK